MDKETLSNYGWIVICVLVLSVMIALATPFGSFVSNAVQNTAEGLFDTGEKALNVVGMTAVEKPEIIEGAGQTYNSNTATVPLSFRSSANYSTFKEVKIDGQIVSSNNYTVTEGSTVITFTNEYAKTLSQGAHTIDIVSDTGIATCDFVSTNPFTKLTTKSWDGLTSFWGQLIWTDGTNIYYSNNSSSYGTIGQYVLNGDTWEPKTWTGLTSFTGDNVWTDGTNIYYSYGSAQYVLNGNTWVKKTWSGLTSFYGMYTWTDGVNTYYSNKSADYVLNGNTWIKKTWNGLANFYGNFVWTDGVNTYYSNVDSYMGTIGNYVLNGDAWEPKTWGGLTSFKGTYTWTDGTNIYYSYGSTQYVLNGNTWIKKTWTGSASLAGATMWTDGKNYYYSSGSIQHVLS